MDVSSDITPTVTLARLYEAQGLLNKAAGMYRQLLVQYPDRDDIRAALQNVDARLAAGGSLAAEVSAEGLPEQLKAWQSAILNRRHELEKDIAAGLSAAVVLGPGAAEVHTQAGDSIGNRESSILEIQQAVDAASRGCGMETIFYLADTEDALLGQVEEAIAAKRDVLVLDPGECGRNCTRLRNRLSGMDISIVEVYFSNIYRQWEFGQRSIIGDIASAQITGLGPLGYAFALEAGRKMALERVWQNITAFR